MSDSPAAVIVSSAGDEVDVIDDAGTKRLAQDAKVTASVLPAGAATETTVATLLTEADFDARVGEVQATPTANTVLGRLKALMDDFTSLLARIPAALVGGRFDTNVGSWLGSVAPTVGQKAMVASVPVTVAGDQSAIQVTVNPGAADGAVAKFVENGGSEDLIVNGSGTPVSFTVDADPTNDIILNSLRIVLSAQTIDFDGGSFGKGSSLTTGVEVKITADNGVFTATLLTLQLNEDFFRLLDVTTSAPPAGAILAASLAFSGDVRLVAGTGDKVEVVVNDNLTVGSLGLNYFTGTVYGVLDL
jgi:hypothetical protein